MLSVDNSDFLGVEMVKEGEGWDLTSGAEVVRQVKAALEFPPW